MRKFRTFFLVFFTIFCFAQLKSQTHKLMCNEAGTFTFAPFLGQSNDPNLPKIFLCRGDSLGIIHNMDFLIQGDPDPTTMPGIAYAMYRSTAPTISGPTIFDISSDPSLVTKNNGALYLQKGNENGDCQIVNSGLFNLNPHFGGGNVPKPISIWFAPITLFNFYGTNPWDANGYCVDVNTDAAFDVIFLNPLEIRNLDATSCLMSYRPYGGAFEYKQSGTYDFEIKNTTNPNAEVLFMSEFNPLSHANILYASVDEPGTYEISLSDGKSCTTQAVIDMTGCNVENNVHLSIPGEVPLPQSSICVPVNISLPEDISSLTLSVAFDPNILRFDEVKTDISDAFILPNINQVLNGKIGFGLSDLSFAALDLAPQDVVAELCFDVIGAVGTYSPLEIVANPYKIEVLNADGTGQLACTRTNGSVYVASTIASKESDMENAIRVFPNPTRKELNVKSKLDIAELSLRNLHGQLVLHESAGTNNWKRLDVEHLVEGTYFLEIKMKNGGLTTRKVKIQR